jgi:SAM-dependent methyltransferase
MAAGSDSDTRQADIEHLHWYLFAQQLCKGYDVLDITSGAGDGGALLAQVARTVVRVVASREPADEATSRQPSPKLRYITGDPLDIPLPDASVDVVVALDLIAQITQPEQLLHQVRRVLRPGGRLIARVRADDADAVEGTTPLDDTFSHRSVFAQRLVLGSVLTAVSPDADARPLVTIERRGASEFQTSSGLPRPASLLLLASDRPIDTTGTSVYIETSRVEPHFEVQRLRAELTYRDEAFANARQEAEDWHRQLVQRNEEVRSLRAAHEAVLTSISWRVTGPLRAAGRLVTYPRTRRRRGHRRASSAARAAQDGGGQPIPVFAPRPIGSGDGGDPSPSGWRGRLLCMSHVLPFPPRAGNEYRIHQMLAWLAAQGWDILLLVCPLDNQPLTSNQLDAAARPYPNLIICQRDGTLHYRLRDGSGMLDGLRSRRPRAFGPMLGEWREASPAGLRLRDLMQAFCPDVFVELVLDLVPAFDPAVLLAEYVFMTRPFALLRPGLFKVVDTHDVFSTRQTKVAQYGIENSLALAPELEAELLDRADLLIAMHEADANSMHKLAPRRPVISCGVDFTASEPSTQPASRPIVLMVGSDNAINVKGLNDFLRFAWPLVRQTLPQAELHLIGRVGDAMDSSLPGVRALGRVENLDAAYLEARVVINPAIAGTGLKIKTVEALAHLRPIVLWPSGVDGLGPELRALCNVATNWFDFARQVIDLAGRPDGARDLTERRSDLARLFAPDAVYEPLGAALQAALQQVAPARPGERRR